MRASLLPALVVSCCLLSSADGALTNDAYKVEITEGASVQITNLAGGSETFRPRFAVIRVSQDPKYAMRYLSIPGVRYHAPSWQTDKKTSALAQANAQVEGGDGFVAEVQKGDTKGRTVDVFQSGDVIRVEGDGAEEKGGKIEWTFPVSKEFRLMAALELPPGKAEPKLTFTFTPQEAGWYSVGYVGAPSVSLSEADEIWQPLIWQEKRFPDESVLTPAGYCTLPASFAVRQGQAFGVVADPSEMAFMPLPRWDNSAFAVALRDEEGDARPMIFAPILGGKGSKMKAGGEFVFQTRLYTGRATAVQAYEAVARSLYGFHDYRRNVGVSLNKVIENIVDYGLSKASRFDEELKGCMYETDVPGAVKNVSSLHPMELAVVMDNEDIFRRRALPILEYLISREKFLFVLDPKMKIQNPSRLLHGPCAEPSEFAAAYAFGGELSPVLLGYAQDLTAQKKVSGRADRWVQLLALYHSTGDPELLKQAREGADRYLEKRMAEPETQFDGKEAGDFFFWTSYSPLWINLLDLYEETGEKRYLDAAHKGALEFTQYVMMSPRIPDGDVTVNPNGQAPIYAYLRSKGHRQMSVPEESVPAWRLSEIGLTPESSPTVLSHRGIFMVNHAAWMLRLAEHTKDQFLHDVARSAVVGRYENFPGYHINTDRTTVYEKADYPYHEHKDLSYNSFHYNHVWPHATLLVDYLVSDIYAKSAGAILFPGRYSQGYGYLQSRIYGDRPGIFYGEKGVRLWMPKGLLSIENPQINYLSGRRGNTLFLALANQSPEEVKTTLRFDPELVKWPAGSARNKIRVWRDNQPAGSLEMTGDAVEIAVSPGGITALMVEGVEMKVGFQDRFGQGDSPTKGMAPVAVPVGDARAMILSFGPGLSRAYVYLRATDDRIASARLRYREGDEWKTVSDDSYPFEFSIPLGSSAQAFEFSLETVAKDGTSEKSDIVNLPLATSQL